MQQRGKLPRCLPTRGLPHALQPRGHGCPLLSADRAWRRVVLLGAVASLQILRQRLLVFVRILRGDYGPLRLLRPVHVGRTALAFTHRPANSRAGQRSPGSRAESFLTCTGSTDRAGLSCRSRCRDNRCGLPLLSTGSAPGIQYFAAPWPARQSLKSTLHPRCRHRRRMTRGQRGSLLLRCGAPSSPTLRRFIPALSDSHHSSLSSRATAYSISLSIINSSGQPPIGWPLDSNTGSYYVAGVGSLSLSGSSR